MNNNAQQSRNIVLIPSTGVRPDRRNVLRWCRKVNGAQHERRRRVGGILTVTEKGTIESESESEDSRLYLKSVTSGEVRRFPADAADHEALYDVYEWAREEIMCSLQAGVDVLFIDEIGPEVIHGEALDAALRACLWKAGEESTKTLFLVIAERSLVPMFCNLYGIGSKDRFVKLPAFRDFLKWESAPADKGGLRTYSWSPNYDKDFVFASDDTSLDEEHDYKYEYSHHGQGPFYSFIRFPLLAATLGVIFTELMGYVFVRQMVNMIENLFRSNRSAHQQLQTATHYTSWRRAARQLDVLENKTSGNVGHVPTIHQFCKSLARLTKQLALEKKRHRLVVREQVKNSVQQSEGSSSSSSSISVATRNDTSGGSESDSRNSASSSFSYNSEHELLSCLRACTTSLVELVNEHLYSMNYVGNNLQMKECVESYILALEEVESTMAPEVLHFPEWTALSKRIGEIHSAAHVGPSTEGVLEAAQSALGGLQNRLWKSPMRATLEALKNSPSIAKSPTGRSILKRLSSFEAEYNQESLKRVPMVPDSPEKTGEEDEGHPDDVEEVDHSENQDQDLDQDEDEYNFHDALDNHDHHHRELQRKLDVAPSPRRALATQAYFDEKPRIYSPEEKRQHLQAAFQHCKLRFYSELAHAYGETALCLSGGAGNAYYHLGVVKTLLERNCLPMHVTGASGGALIGAFVCTRTDEELRQDLRAELLCKVFDPCSAGYSGMARHLLEHGTLFDVEDWIAKMTKKVCGDLTFQEAYEKTGRSFTITVYNIDAKGRNHTRVLNHKVTPNVVIYSAVLASSALPKLLPPVELLRKDARGNITEYHSLGKFWRDGSFENELPFEALRQLFNVTFPIVSQVEPHISPFFYDNRGAAGKSVAHRGGRGWRGGFLLSYFERLLKLDIKKWLELVRDFNLLPKVMETDMSSIFLGRTRGACTLVPPIMLSSYTNLVSDPNTPSKMQRYLSVGQQMAWPKLNMIQDRLRVERKLHELAFR